jgi:hypothetical protein
MTDSAYKSMLSLWDFEAEVLDYGIDLTFNLRSQAATSFNIDAYSSRFNRIANVVLRYLVVESSWGSFEFVWVRHITGCSLVAGSFCNFTVGGMNVNMTGGVKTFAVINGFHMLNTTNQTVLGLDLAVSQVNATTHQASLSTSSGIAISIE